MNEPDDDGSKTCLHKAILNGRRDAVRSLLDGGVDVNASHKFYNAPLHVAAEEGCAQTVRELLERGANVDEPTRLLDSRLTALHIAAKSSDPEVARLLLGAGARVDARSADGSTPLHLACRHSGGPALVELLLASGADVAARTADGRTPLGLACSSRNDAAVGLLLGRGARPDAASLRLALDEPDDSSAFQPSSEDARARRRNVVAALLARGDAPVNATDPDGRSPLLRALATYDVGLVGMLLERGARPGARDAEGRTPLHCFAADGLPKPFIRDHCSRPRFQRLADATQAEIAGLLVRWGADVDARRGRDRRSALHVAASRNYARIVEALLAAGAELDCRDADGSTALHLACGNGCLEVVEALLRSGADANALDLRGRAALQLADEFDEAVAELLQRHVLKLRLAELPVCEQNQLELAVLDERIGIEYCIGCLGQVEAMRATRFHASTASFYDVLAGGALQVSRLLANPSVLEALESGAYRQAFPEYADLIGSSFERGKRRRQLLERACGSDLFHSIFSNVPRVCVEQILGYLDAADLRCLASD